MWDVASITLKRALLVVHDFNLFHFILSACRVQVHTLPGLEPIQAVQLGMLDGFPPSWPEPEPVGDTPIHLGAWSPDASALMLMSPSGELARVSLLDGLGRPARCSALIQLGNLLFASSSAYCTKYYRV